MSWSKSSETRSSSRRRAGGSVGRVLHVCRRGAALLFALLAAIPTACDDSECEDQQQGCGEGASGASGGNNAGGSGGSGATGGNGGQGGEGGSVIPSECNPTEGAEIGADCGVFVAAGANGSGTQASPFGTITQAAASLGAATRIYVCSSDTAPASVTVAGGVSIFGGLSCDAWVYTSAQAHPKILGDEDVPALVISGAGNSRLKSLDVEAPDAVADGAKIAIAPRSITTVARTPAQTNGQETMGWPWSEFIK